MILQKGEKILVIHRRFFEKDIRRHFIGVVDDYEAGVVRATGHVYIYDPLKACFARRREGRTRIMSLASGDLLVNVLPASVDLEKIVYESGKGFLRITDGSGWHLDVTEFTWLDSAIA